MTMDPGHQLVVTEPPPDHVVIRWPGQPVEPDGRHLPNWLLKHLWPHLPEGQTIDWSAP